MTTKKSFSTEDGPATKKDFLKLDAKINALDAKLDSRAQGLDDKIGALDVNLNAKIDALDVKLGAKIDGTNHRLDNVEATTKRLAVSVVNLESDVREIKATMMTKEEFRQGLATMTGIASRFDQEHRATLFQGEALTDVQVKVRDHEARLRRLETPKSQA